uniref:Uncharacterized protein n=1 Tax=Panagrolaimus sp. PS1159 TaxID=55785 RepID=A0AC35GK71_9BILA
MDSMKSDVPKLFFPNPTQFRESCLPQEFSFRKPIMEYIWKNPSTPKVYQKLIQCCKTFFIKNPILVIEYLEYNYDGWKYCKRKDCSKCFLQYFHGGHDMEKLDTDKLLCDIWLSKKLYVTTYGNLGRIASNVIPKISRYDVVYLVLGNELLYFDELKFFSKGVKECSLHWNLVKYSNGEEVPLENIIRLFTNSKKVFMNFSSRSQNAACRSYDDFIDACSTIENVGFYLIPRDFDVPKFYQHLKKSKNRCSFSIFSGDYVSRLREVIDEILQTANFEFVPPVIDYIVRDEQKLQRMRKIQETESSKYR